MNCKGCGQPMLPRGAIKKPNEYDHARGCLFRPKRVRLSLAGIEAHIAHGGAKARGWMYPNSHTCPGCVRIKWDHRKDRQTIHESFVEVIS
jgi:hypothetical protein